MTAFFRCQAFPVTPDNRMIQLSAQIYSLRNFGDLNAQMALLRDCGFEWVESVAAHGLAHQAFADTLNRHGLKLSSMHANLVQVEGQREMLVELCKLTGCPLVVMPYLPIGERPSTAAGWRAMGLRLAGVGRAFAREGIRFGYHNHDFEFLNYDGRPALEWLFDGTAPADLGWQADMGWVHRAGASTTTWAERFADRLVAVHTKDIAREGDARDEDGWAAVGQGVMPWAALFAVLRQHTELFVFEHDNPKESAARLRDSLACMKQHLLA